MKPSKTLFVAAAFGIAIAFPSVSQAADPIVVLNEEFDELASLTGWSTNNQSSPQGQSWFQGNPGVFAAYQGMPNSYAAANFLSALDGRGTIDNWLITPQLTLFGASTLSFFARGAQDVGVNDTLEIRFSPGGGAAPADFSTLLGTLGGGSAFPDTWYQSVMALDFTGTGRFAFRYTGDAATANYIGIDSLRVTSVPEPSAYLMLLAGLGALRLLRRTPSL